MSDEMIGTIGVLIFLILLFLGVPIVMACILVGLGGIAQIMGD